LQEIADQHHLDAAERFRPVARETQGPIDDIEQVASHIDTSSMTRRSILPMSLRLRAPGFTSSD